MQNKVTISKFYFGHHKCATTWAKAIVKIACKDLGLTFSTLHNPKMFNEDLRTYVAQGQVDFIAYINANYQYLAGMQGLYKGFHIIRDPRDIIVSSYFSSLNSHPTLEWPELVPHREKLRTVSKQEGMLLEMEFIHDVLDDISTWNYQQPEVLELRFEDVTLQSYTAFLDIFKFLGILDDSRMSKRQIFLYTLTSLVRRKMGLLGMGKGIPAQALLGIVYENQFSRRAGGRALGAENSMSHFRKGSAGDWVNHFSDDQKALFKKSYGDLVVKLGYEQHNDW